MKKGEQWLPGDGAGKGLAMMRHEETFRGNGNILYVDYTGDSMSVYLSKLLKLQTLNGCSLLYLNIVEK